MDDYASLVTAMKALTQGEGNDTITLPMAEDEWETRPEANSYGTIRLDFEVDPLNGDDKKVCRAFEGSVDLFSRSRNGDGWIEEIETTLAAYCDSAWQLNLRAYEHETRLFHWEWSFQVEG